MNAQLVDADGNGVDASSVKWLVVPANGMIEITNHDNATGSKKVGDFVVHGVASATLKIAESAKPGNMAIALSIDHSDAVDISATIAASESGNDGCVVVDAGVEDASPVDAAIDAKMMDAAIDADADRLMSCTIPNRCGRRRSATDHRLELELEHIERHESYDRDDRMVGALGPPRRTGIDRG